ncbi:MAG: ZPR1 zinc finger domain-containing protein [Canidatus Methanoxibalbensis ujae]|nr:ZPR1 zinc finger domain-containing protein [Candidatus Methanoxibalbensis ujae]MCW7078823.1 ZPR1 zinc finger domain-containing protein [Candidatus Methanoxibalbensis ujae]
MTAKKGGELGIRGARTLNVRCSACNRTSVLNIAPYEVPYFGDILIFTEICGHCGFRSTDVMIVSERKSVRYEMRVSSVRDLNARVVRSSSGRIEIPELGVNIEPKKGEAFITTVEGVIERVRRIVEMLARSVEGDARKRRAAEILRKIEDIKEGKATMTLILEDPTGNSAIIVEP